jgi:hypothetical protein
VLAQDGGPRCLISSSRTTVSIPHTQHTRQLSGGKVDPVICKKWTCVQKTYESSSTRKSKSKRERDTQSDMSKLVCLQSLSLFLTPWHRLLKSNCKFLGHKIWAHRVRPAAAKSAYICQGDGHTHHHVVGDVDVRLGAVDQHKGDVVVVVGLLPGRERVAVGVVAELDLALAAGAAAGAAAVARRRPRGAVGRPQWTHLRHWCVWKLRSGAKTKVRAAFLPLGASLVAARRLPGASLRARCAPAGSRRDGKQVDGWWERQGLRRSRTGQRGGMRANAEDYHHRHMMRLLPAGMPKPTPRETKGCPLPRGIFVCHPLTKRPGAQQILCFFFILFGEMLLWRP